MNNTTVSPTGVHSAVQARYHALAVSGGTCCEPASAASGCCDDLYESDLSNLPADATALSLGCGDPIVLAKLQPGETVLDLGSGGGIDCFLAAERVGPAGRVIGLDMTPAMIDRANANREKVGAANVEFRHGKIEQMPLPANAVDVIISNCVVNLAPDKQRVFDEAFRVLRPGGRLAISDMVTQGHFSDADRADMDSWSACVSGAADVGDLARWLRASGFSDVSIRDKGAPDVELADTVALTETPRLFSARIAARKPQTMTEEIQ